MTRTPNTEHSLFARFLSLAGIELILVGAWMLFIALSQNLRITTVLAVVVMIVGAVCLAAPTFLKNQAATVVSVLSSGNGKLAMLAIPVLLSGFFYLHSPSISALKIIGPVLVSLWLIGIEALFFFQEPKDAKIGPTTSNRLTYLALALAYGVLIIPSRAPSLLNGFPLNTPLEFITATLILPFTFFFGKRILTSKPVTLLLTLLLLAKLGLSFFIPQAGLGVQVYFSEEALASNKWERTYESFIAPAYSQVVELPYRSFYELPIESINRHGFDKESFWMTLKFSGVIALNEGERLVVLVQGTSERQIELVDLATGERFEVATAKSVDDLDAGLFNDIPYVGKAEFTGSLVFTNYGNGHFEPIILKSDGSTRSAFSNIWLSPSAFDFPISGYQFAQNLIAIILLGILIFGLFDGILALYRTGVLDVVDVYLALTGFILYYVTDAADKPSIHLLFIAIAFLFAVVKLLDFILRSRPYSNSAYLFSIGLPVLLMFLPLDIHSLQTVVVLPQYQDVMEYQMLARNIYVAGDAFLLQSPPWAYKVLFPYIIGLLHILFGQSLSSQFFLNIWSALLSVMLTIDLAVYFGFSKPASFAAASMSFLLLLLPVSFIFFFRFGLIEPVAILTLLLVAYFAADGKFAAMFVLGLVTGMLRLNYAGAIFTAVTFLAPAFTGGFSQAWGSFFNWLRLHWMRWVAYLVAIPLPSLIIAYIYSRFHPEYTLTHEMNNQTSIGSVLMSLVSVIVGGDEEFLRNQIQQNPQDLVLITLPILLGLIVALVSLIYRKGIFAKLDLRLSLFLLSMLPVYAVLKPIGYFPRYSWSFLPPALILLGLFLQFAFLKDNRVIQLSLENA